MEDKEALDHLIKILSKYKLSTEEVDAIKLAIGVLSWTSLRKGALQNMRAKKLEKKRNSLQ